MRVDQAFDEMSSDYDERIRRYVPHYEQLVACASNLPTDQVHQVLDLGSGSGAVIRSLLDQKEDLVITAVDASTDMIELLKGRFQTYQVLTHQVWLQDLALSPGQFQLITASMSIHHLVTSEKAELFSKLFHLLSLGGALQISDAIISKTDEDHQHFIDSWRSLVMDNGGTETDWQDIMEHYDQYDRPDNRETHERLLYKAGFHEVTPTFQQGHWISLRATRD